MNIYFAGSIRGGREKVEDYKKIIEVLSSFGTVLTEHIGDSSISIFGQKTMTDSEIYKKDTSWIDQSDIIVAEVTVPSLGVGYELGYAEAMNKKVICLYQVGEGRKLSAMIAGNQNIIVVEYESVSEIEEKLRVHLV